MTNLDVLTGSSTSTTANHIVSIADVCQYLNLSTTSSATGFLSNAIGRISSTFESYIGLPIKEQQFLGYYNGYNSLLYLNNYPITSLVSLKYRNSPTEGYNFDITNDVQIDGVGRYRIYYPFNPFLVALIPFKLYTTPDIQLFRMIYNKLESKQ